VVVPDIEVVVVVVLATVVVRDFLQIGVISERALPGSSVFQCKS
jgi:hypothetical protein